MTRQGWAEKVIARTFQAHKGPLTGYAVKALLAEHKRAVRVVKREIANLEVMKSRSFRNAEIAEAYASIQVLHGILATLQRGRE